MSIIEVLNENPICLGEVKDKLEAIQKRDKDAELSETANKALEYAGHFVKLDIKKIQKLREALEGLNIPRLRERHFAKLIDIFPEDMDSLRTVFIGETVTVKQEDLNKILEVMKKNK